MVSTLCFLSSRVKEVLPPPKSECVPFDCSNNKKENNTFEKLANTGTDSPSRRVSICLFLVCAEEPDVRTRKIVKVVTQTMVDGKVVDESSEVEQIEETRK